jgi:hypothetical protein
MKTQRDFAKFINRIKPGGAAVSARVINLDTGESLDYNGDMPLYPASVYKIFIAAEVLRSAECGGLKLSAQIKIKTPNDIDAEARFYPTDFFPVLHAGDTASVEDLLKMMLRRSDNTASNTLIDLVGRENISKNIIHANGWAGSDITRKFLNRSLENGNFRYAETTRSSGAHLADFMRKLHKGKLVSPFVSKKLKEYMSDGALFRRDSLSKELIHRRGDNWLSHVVLEKGGWFQMRTRNPIRAVKWGGFFLRHQAQAAIARTACGTFAIGIICKYAAVFPSKYFKLSKITEWIDK